MIDSYLVTKGVVDKVEYLVHYIAGACVDKDTTALQNDWVIQIANQCIILIFASFTAHSHEEIFVHAGRRTHHLRNLQLLHDRLHCVRISSGSKAQNCRLFGLVGHHMQDDIAQGEEGSSEIMTKF